MYRVYSFDQVSDVETWLNRQAEEGYFLVTMTSHFVPAPPAGEGYSPYSANRAFFIVTVKKAT